MVRTFSLPDIKIWTELLVYSRLWYENLCKIVDIGNLVSGGLQRVRSHLTSVRSASTISWYKLKSSTTVPHNTCVQRRVRKYATWVRVEQRNWSTNLYFNLYFLLLYALIFVFLNIFCSLYTKYICYNFIYWTYKHNFFFYCNWGTVNWLYCTFYKQNV